MARRVKEMKREKEKIRWMSWFGGDGRQRRTDDEAWTWVVIERVRCEETGV
jgi:hypothetical protein